MDIPMFVGILALYCEIDALDARKLLLFVDKRIGENTIVQFAYQPIWNWSVDSKEYTVELDEYVTSDGAFLQCGYLAEVDILFVYDDGIRAFAASQHN